MHESFVVLLYNILYVYTFVGPVQKTAGPVPNATGPVHFFYRLCARVWLSIKYAGNGLCHIQIYIYIYIYIYICIIMSHSMSSQPIFRKFQKLMA